MCVCVCVCVCVLRNGSRERGPINHRTSIIGDCLDTSHSRESSVYDDSMNVRFALVHIPLS